MVNKVAFVLLETDLVHHGHINIIKKAAELGDIVIGLYTDEVIASHGSAPIIPYESRKIIAEGLKGVVKVIPQETLDFTLTLRSLKPDYVVHGDDWIEGPLSERRKKLLSIIDEWGGKLVEPKYTKGISSSLIKESIEEGVRIDREGVTASQRLKKLKKLLEVKPLVRILEAHNGLSGLIVEKTRVNGNEFDGIWASSLTDSTVKGKPDTEVVDFTSRFGTIEEIMEVSTKPIIIDGDTGGKTEHFRFRVKTLERLGVSAVIIEDKVGSKRNSLFGNDISQEQSPIEIFCDKIEQGKSVQITNDFMIIARIESLILNKGLDDALERSMAYNSAGADGIMIHSKKNSGKEIFDFCQEYRKFENKKPLIVVPSAFPQVGEEELIDWGVNVVIYANHLLRSSYPSMVKTANSILQNSRAKEAADRYCMPIKEILTLIPEDY